LRSVISRGFVMFAGLLALSASTHTEPVKVRQATQKDPRLQRLRQFFLERNCPIKDLAEDFIVAADNNDLDWRLLPSLAIVESGGGKACMNNNIFGWGSCKRRFASVRHGIHYVAYALGNSVLYRGKTVPEILKTYNPRPIYRDRVQSMMASLGPELLLDSH